MMNFHYIDNNLYDSDSRNIVDKKYKNSEYILFEDFRVHQ